MRAYKCLSKQEYTNGEYRLVPIRDEDKYLIMKWRNEQIYHLRQSSPLTVEGQDIYFKNVVKKLFTTERPDQILFSFLQNDECIGYGGLVHINWKDENAEVSFLLNSSIRFSSKLFEKLFAIYLGLISSISFDELEFVKLNTTFYDIPERESYRKIIEAEGYIKEAQLRGQKKIGLNLVDVYTFSKFNESKKK